MYVYKYIYIYIYIYNKDAIKAKDVNNSFYDHLQKTHGMKLIGKRAFIQTKKEIMTGE